ncbi:MAG TPA: ABC transporter permease [Vicinamibacterales bacterium]|nr:ABC transporter permease [Vicinamibacterales bacterium]
MPDLHARVRSAFASTAIDSDILDELAQHAESTYEELRAEGFSEEQAIARIDQLIDGWRIDPKSLQRVVKRATAVVPPASPALLSGAIADAIYGLRLLRANPGYTAITILTIALGAGAVTTLFSVAYGVLLRPLSWGNGDGLVRVIESRGGKQGRIPGTMMNGTYVAWSDSPQTIESIGAWRDGTVTLTGVGDARRVNIASITPSMFDVLRIQLLRGRRFAAEEGRQGNTGFAVLSYAMWQQQFGGREDVLNQQIVLDGSPYAVVGIMPREFAFPTSQTQIWLPTEITSVDGPNGVKRGQIFRALARLRPGVTASQAAAEATARAVAAPDAGPLGMTLFGGRDPIQISIVDAAAAATAEVRPAILVLLIASALLFVTAIANVANMQLARATGRARELTIRAALGAGTTRLSRQLLIENAIIAVAGAAMGIMLAIALHRVMPSMLPAQFPRVDDITIDGRVLAFAAALSAITTIVAGLLPMLQLRRLDLVRALSEGSLASAGAGRSRLALTRVLVVGSQVAVTSVLLIGAALLMRSFVAQTIADRGYDPANVLTATVPFPGGRTFEWRQQARVRIIERLKSRAGVTHAAFSTGVPLMSAGGFTSFNFTSPFRDGIDIEAQSIRRLITPEYFGALGIRVRAGRAISDRDTLGAPTAVVVNRSFVREFLDDVAIERAVGVSIGKNAVRGSNYDGGATIVGVVDDVKQDAIDGPPQPEMFVSLAQMSQATLGEGSIVIVRTADDPARYVDVVRTAIREEDPAIALDAVMTMDQRVGESLSRPRTYAVLFAGFALFALVIAGAGLFGVLSHSVSQRSRELAVRSALGASRSAVIAVALKQMAVAMIAGVAIGVAASMALSNNLAPFIYGVSTRDMVSFGIAPIVLLAAGAIACVVPARRVAQTDPVTVLREA